MAGRSTPTRRSGWLPCSGRIPTVIPWLGPHDPFPPTELALAEPNGLLAAGGRLDPGSLLEAYRRGIFPWSSDGEPLLWWSPDPRMVLFVDEFKLSRSLRKRVRSGQFEVRVDTACAEVIHACAGPRQDQDGTWITDAVEAAYLALHRRGYVHSVETWVGDRLVGGLYGVALGRVFYGESMFATQSDASKVALAHLVRILRDLDVPLIDCQQETSHLASLGARPISRARFAGLLAELIHSAAPPPGWRKGIVAPEPA